MDAREEMLNLLNRIWAKLQGLPKASPIDLGAFFVLLTFMCESEFFDILNPYYSTTMWPMPFIFSSSGVPVHAGANLRNMLLLPQNQDEEVDHLSKCDPHNRINTCNKLSLQSNCPRKTQKQSLPLHQLESCRLNENQTYGHVMID